MHGAKRSACRKRETGTGSGCCCNGTKTWDRRDVHRFLRIRTWGTSRLSQVIQVIVPRLLCLTRRVQFTSPTSPDPAAILADHRLSWFAAKGLLKFLHVHHQSVDTVLAW